LGFPLAKISTKKKASKIVLIAEEILFVFNTETFGIGEKQKDWNGE